MNRSPLLSKMRTEIRRRNYSYRTEQAYTKWVVRFVRYHNLRHPANLGKEEVIHYLEYLVNERKMDILKQKQALAALIFLYEHVLHSPLQKSQEVNRGGRPKSHDTVFDNNTLVALA